MPAEILDHKNYDYYLNETFGPISALIKNVDGRYYVLFERGDYRIVEPKDFERYIHRKPQYVPYTLPKEVPLDRIFIGPYQGGTEYCTVGAYIDKTKKVLMIQYLNTLLDELFCDVATSFNIATYYWKDTGEPFGKRVA